MQLFHRGWDQHRDLPNNSLASGAEDTESGSAATIIDREAWRLLDDTLVIWGGSSVEPIYHRKSDAEATVATITAAQHQICGPASAESGGASPGAAPTTARTT